jgi:hypothetical protein
VDLSHEERPSLPSAADLNSSLSEPKTAHKSAQEAAPEERYCCFLIFSFSFSFTFFSFSFTFFSSFLTHSFHSNKKLRASNEKVDESTPFPPHKADSFSNGTGPNSSSSSSSSAKESEREKGERVAERSGSKKDDDYYDRESDNENGMKGE